MSDIEILKEVEELREENKELKAKIAKLQKIIDEGSKILAENNRKIIEKDGPIKYRGWSVSLRENHGKFYYYGTKNVNGKNKSVYVGKDSSKTQEKIDAWEKKNNSENKAVKKKASKKASDQEILKFVIKNHKRLCKENSRRAGSVTIPEMWDLLKGKYALSLERFHKLLQEWMKEEKIGLWVCDSPKQEERASEGIQGKYGLLFYIRMVDESTLSGKELEAFIKDVGKDVCDNLRGNSSGTTIPRLYEAIKTRAGKEIDKKEFIKVLDVLFLEQVLVLPCVNHIEACEGSDMYIKSKDGQVAFYVEWRD